MNRSAMPLGLLLAAGLAFAIPGREHGSQAAPEVPSAPPTVSDAIQRPAPAGCVPAQLESIRLTAAPATSPFEFLSPRGRRQLAQASAMEPLAIPFLPAPARQLDPYAGDALDISVDSLLAPRLSREEKESSGRSGWGWLADDLQRGESAAGDRQAIPSWESDLFPSERSPVSSMPEREGALRRPRAQIYDDL